MKKQRFIASIIEIVLGIILVVCCISGIIEDAYWNGMGTALVVVGVLQLIRHRKYKTNEEYAERVNVTNTDERNHYLANKARSWAFYYSILLECVGTIVLRVMEYPELSSLLGFVVCGQLVIYWGSWFYLKKRY